MDWVFDPQHPFWPEISSLVVGTFLLWERHRVWRTLTIEPVRFIGNHCDCLQLLDVSQFMGVTGGLRELALCRLKQVNKPRSHQMPPLLSQDNQFVRHLQQIVIGSAFEKCKPTIYSRWGKGKKHFNTWPPVLLFAYHVRNGCFHGNTFTFRHSYFPPPWRGLTLSRGDEGRNVMGLAHGMLGLADIIALLRDISIEVS